MVPRRLDVGFRAAGFAQVVFELNLALNFLPVSLDILPSLDSVGTWFEITLCSQSRRRAAENDGCG
jgi:hypothetical protein